METVFSLLQYAVAFLLGTLTAVSLSGADEKPLWKGKLVAIISMQLGMQCVCLAIMGLDATKKLYPLLVHIPLWLMIVLVLKTPLIQTAVAVLTAYMCCQGARWIASIGLIIPEETLLYQLLYIPAAAIVLYVLWRYLSATIRRFAERSRRACLLMGLVPALYYCFDYVTTVYTRLLFSGNQVAVQFMPSVVSVAYLVFIFLYGAEMEKQLSLSKERDILEAQLRQSKLTVTAMQQLQEKTRLYRHDMRHHLLVLQGFAAEGSVEKIRQYLESVSQDLEDMTPERYCSNEMVNLLLTYYCGQARAQGVQYSASVSIPGQLSCSETELCAVLANALENAVDAASHVEPQAQPRVSVHMGIHSSNLLIQVENTYAGTLQWRDGLPCSRVDEHGFGTRSIRAVLRKYGGEAVFQACDGIFRLRAILPNNPAVDE